MKGRWPQLPILAGGALMTAAFFLPWAQASLFGFHQPIFSAADLAEREPGWYLVSLCGVLTLLLGGAGLAAGPRRPRLGLYSGAGALLLSLVCAIFIWRVWSGLQGEGITFSWIEGATAKDLALSLRYGIFVELAGCALAALGGLLAALSRSRSLSVGMSSGKLFK